MMILEFRRREGSVVTMLMGTVAMVGVVSVAAMNMIGGPITTAAKVTHQNMAQNDLLMNAKVVVMNASTRPQMGDEDGDGYIEPAPFIPTSHPSCNITLPAEGGCLPYDIGAIQTDPWGTQYAYCVWDHGDPRSSVNRIDGEGSTSGAVLAIISAGSNKRFETPCLPYDGDPNTNDEAINPQGIGDDLVQIFTYAGAVAGSGGLWELKLNEPETAVIDKKLEIGDVSAGTGFAFDTSTGTGEFPYVKTDFLASKTGGNRPVTMMNNIALDGYWLSGNGTNRGIFIDAQGRIKLGGGNNPPFAILDVNAYPTRTHGVDPLTSVASDFAILLGCKTSGAGPTATCGTGRAVGFTLARQNSSQPNAMLEYRAGAHSFHNFAVDTPILRMDSGYLYQDNTVVIRSSSTAADKGILGLERSNGANALTVLNNGNVGIGTANPATRLEVEGSVVTGLQGIYSATAPTGKRFWAQGINNSTGNLYIGYRNDDAKTPGLLDVVPLWIQHGAPNNALTLHANGRVGIGTSTPAQALDVSGSIVTRDGHIVSASNNGALVFNIGPESTSNSGFWFRQVEAGNGANNPPYSSLMRITRDGRVGIGITTPTEKLQVDGLIDVTNNRILRVATPTATTDAANKAYVDTLGGRTSCTNGQVLKWNGTTWICAGDSIGVPDNMGTHTAAQNIRLNGHWLSGDGDNEGVFVTSNGAVGIGTSTPTGALHVQGTSVISNGSGSIRITNSSISDQFNYIQSGDGAGTQGSWRGLVFGAYNHNANATPPKLIIHTNGNVGIGTSAPIAKLHVAGGTFVETNWAYDSIRFINNKSVYTGTDHSWHFYPQGNTTAQASNESFFRIGIRNVETGIPLPAFLSIRNDGNVGIGVGNPLSKLHIAGNGLFAGSVTANAYYQSSDRNLKSNIERISDPFALLESIEGKRFVWKDSKKPAYGVIAQDVEAVMPDAVGENDAGFKTVEYDQLIAPLIEAVKQLEGRVRHLEAANDNLKADNNNLRDEIRAMTKGAK